MSFALGLEIGLLLGKKKFGGSVEPSDDWQPPADWLTVPEPGSYDINLLVEVTDNNNSGAGIQIGVVRPIDANTGYGTLSVDWGDGTVQSWKGVINNDDGTQDYTESWSTLRHIYSAAGQYIIKVTTTDQSCFLQTMYDSGIAKILIAKLGSSITINSDDISGNDYFTQWAFASKRYLHWVKFSGKFTRKQTFQNCGSLRKVENLTPAEELPEQCFQNCYCLKKFDFSTVKKIGTYSCQSSGLKKAVLPQCTEISNGAFQYSALQQINAPICTTAGNQALGQCYDLSEAAFAENCTYGSCCFVNCYSLAVRPDGTTTKDYT